ncbi:imidazoleglycerol phosphate synthase, cyclase subunit [Acidimicrobium ferrooxidans DSM 10331]|uniref:Imidazole glycerol phosphate synthase subunit HisF n=1 Tax=Acidimicrobium ferrooxidans (strain DSM 10331 / JCM 15462 / NBRC 103882 / ICP) TaxID=525909 RepID=C7LZ81_ACIFD|nr:imidazole glycerol phosphate synthase subunit HisF [Acidimicrobium ferrooxidans]ACU54039.1 imidazoleglycerol phosphate synthase, cyclase subunit [Acidimicrobium ferrooxidans DSM 10331]
MQSVRVIPCLDVAEGRVVKGVSFVELRDAGDPVELAERYVAEGADELVFLDITASIEERSTLVDLVERVASRVFIPFTVGGGVRVLGDVAALLEAGADKVSMNSAAVADLGLVEAVAGRYGSQCAVVAIDAARTGAGDWEVRTHGGRRPTGLDVETWVRRVSDAGAGELLVTSMDRDGTRAGYDTDLYELVLSCTSLPVIASGGVGIVEHFVDGARTGVTGLLAASVFHYGELSVAQVKAALDAAGLVVRPIGG